MVCTCQLLCCPPQPTDSVLLRNVLPLSKAWQTTLPEAGLLRHLAIPSLQTVSGRPYAAVLEGLRQSLG